MPDAHVNFYLSSKASVVVLECIEIEHPSFSQVHRVVRNAVRGITVKHEDGNDYPYDYYPLLLERKAAAGDIDYGFRITLGDLGGALQDELDRVFTNQTTQTKPVCRFRLYRSDNLAHPINGPHETIVNEIAFNHEGAEFEAVAPYKNVAATGKLYSLNDFPMMRAFL